jgi:hypothetical protein
MSTEISLALVLSVKMGAVQTSLILEVYVNIYPLFPPALPDLVEIRYNISSYNAVEHLWVY